MTLLLRSLLLAWFLCALLFMYAVPMVVVRHAPWFGGLYGSVRIAARRIAPTCIAALILGGIEVGARSLADLLYRVPYAGQFLGLLVLQLTIGYFAVFTLNLYLALSDPAFTDVLKVRTAD